VPRLPLPRDERPPGAPLAVDARSKAYGRMFWFIRNTLTGSHARSSRDQPFALGVAVDGAHNVVPELDDVVHVSGRWFGTA
jgi:hypothetical protein